MGCEHSAGRDLLQDILTHLQIVKPDRAARIPAVGREKPGFKCQQAQCVVGFDVKLGACAGVCVQSGGHVNGEYGRTTGIHLTYPACHLAIRFTLARANT